MIFFQFKNKGILVPVYVIVSLIIMGIIAGELKRNVGGIFKEEYIFNGFVGLGFLISGLWTYFTSSDYIDIEGQKKKVFINHQFFYIPMVIWGYGLIILGALAILVSFLESLGN